MNNEGFSKRITEPILCRNSRCQRPRHKHEQREFILEMISTPPVVPGRFVSLSALFDVVGSYETEISHGRVLWQTH